MVSTATPTVRRIDFEYPNDFDPRWHQRLPEFSCGANAVSMLMPHLEPVVARAVRDALPPDDAELAERGSAYVRQETQHHRQHRQFNRILLNRYAGLAVLDRTLARILGLIDRHSSAPFALAFATGFESVAYSAARWTAGRRHDLLTGADPVAATLFLWHLAEEVEHKSVAHDVWATTSGSRWRLIAGSVLAMALLAVTALIGTLVMLVHERRILHPLAHWRLLTWTFGLTFTMLPDVVASWLPGHHPDNAADPSWYQAWLAEYDASDGTMPLWEASLTA
ncbi:MAG: metal-dependent hydrolase [Acidimicrobiia bacterium]|nr:metal-dependent hydrolase [Acidimicrobiia bacterium]